MVVVGRVAGPDANDAPHVIALAVPLSRTSISNSCPELGVPDRLVVNEVIASASAVIW